MNLQEIAGGQPQNRVLQRKLQQQQRQILQLEAENKWLREQLAKIAAREDKAVASLFQKRK